jgi:hypothetical protein
MTGDVVRDAAIVDCQPLLERLYEQMRPAPPLELPAPTLPTASDLEVLAKVRARYGDRADNLSRGNWSGYHPSQSEGDLEYGVMVARFTSDADQWLRLFLQSALGATLERKGTPKHQRDYLSWTYDKARRLSDEENYHVEFGRRVAEAILASVMASIRSMVASWLVPWEHFVAVDPTLLLVKGLLGQGGVSVLYGEPGTGKSFLALDISIAIATGCAWMGLATKRGKVLYAAGEGVSGLRNRRTALVKARGIENVPLAFLTVALNTPREVETFLLVLEQFERMYGAPPALLILDTLARYFGDGDENQAQHMGLFLSTIDQLRRKYPNMHVMIVHHAGKDSTKGMRGSSALKGALDTAILCTKSKTKTGETRYLAIVEKQKDGQEGLTFPFRLRPIEVGLDEEGKPITSCVVEPDREVLATRAALTEPQGVAVSILRELARTDAIMNSEIDYKAYRDRFCQLRGDNDQKVRKAARFAIEHLRDRYGAVDWVGGQEPIRLLPRLWNLPVSA